ncbi:MAG: gamma-butyrobetaine hydroxylase-like domain-containing protein, partial [Acidobacteriota bacterium]
MSREAVTPAKVRVLLSEGKGLEIDWADGHQSAWSFAWLREACPCATCVEQRKQEGRRPGETKPKPQDLLPLY